MGKARMEAFSDGHHMLHTCAKATGPVGWMGENHFAATPTALYALIWLVPDKRIENALATQERPS